MPRARTLRKQRGGTQLTDVINDNNIAAIQGMIEDGSIVSQINTVWGGWSPLNIAVENGNIEIIHLLLSVPGININKQDSVFQRTPLMQAAQNDNLEIVQLLLAVPGINPNLSDAAGLKAYQLTHNPVIRQLLINASLNNNNNNNNYNNNNNNNNYNNNNNIYNNNNNANNFGLKGLFMNALPRNAENAITLEPIHEGENMVNFHDEANHGRYYKKSSYNLIHTPKINPFTRKRILKRNVTAYKAKLQGGKRWKK